MGPFAAVEEKNVGPSMAFTMYRHMMLTQKHPVITWGNGTGSSPQTYGVMLKLWASHGFIVIASNRPNVGQGTPPPMLDGVTYSVTVFPGLQDRGGNASRESRTILFSVGGETPITLSLVLG